MKRILKFFGIILFFCLLFNINFLPTKFVNAENIENGREYEFVFNGKHFKYFSSDYEGFNRSEFYKTNNKNIDLKKLTEMGFSKRESIYYLYPEISYIEKELEKIVDIKAEDGAVYVIKNSCKLYFEDCKGGQFLNKNKLFDDLFENLLLNNKKIKINLSKISINPEKIEKNYKEKSCFSTSYASSSLERKNNIKIALSKFDGLVLEPGEVFSFNTVTGERGESAGYQKAKIISGGTFVSGFGGGVCQVSSTIYNACLIAGLEILEVHNHSLPVSYVTAGFDAMVNMGSSDLVVRNNTGAKTIITTRYEDDKCFVKIFGKENKFKIERQSEKTKIVPHGEEVVDCNYLKYPDLNLEVGEEKQVSYAKDGFYADSYLIYYDKNGNFVKKVKIRQNFYKPTNSLIVKREK